MAQRRLPKEITDGGDQRTDGVLRPFVMGRTPGGVTHLRSNRTQSGLSDSLAIGGGGGTTDPTLATKYETISDSATGTAVPGLGTLVSFSTTGLFANAVVSAEWTKPNTDTTYVYVGFGADTGGRWAGNPALTTAWSPTIPLKIQGSGTGSASKSLLQPIFYPGVTEGGYVEPFSVWAPINSEAGPGVIDRNTTDSPAGFTKEAAIPAWETPGDTFYVDTVAAAGGDGFDTSFTALTLDVTFSAIGRGFQFV